MQTEHGYRPGKLYSFVLATPEDTATLPHFDNTKATAIHTCPTWGIVRYHKHKAMSAPRNLALEAGTAMHDVFAWVRVMTYVWHTEVEHRAERLHAQMIRLFTAERWERLQTMFSVPIECMDEMEWQGITKNGAIYILATSGFYDDPRDKRRTVSNLEVCAFAYIDRWDFDRRVAYAGSFVGIEIPFALTAINPAGDRKFVFTGRLDGIHVSKRTGQIIVEDNKTASRLGEHWANSFIMSPQVIGYTVAARVLLGNYEINRARILGLTIPFPRNEADGFVAEDLRYEQHHYNEWERWLNNAVQIARAWEDHPTEAPKHFHACYRYFNTCSFLSMCHSSPEERKAMYEHLVDDEWTPLSEGHVNE